jgi:hypothetical protein
MISYSPIKFAFITSSYKSSGHLLTLPGNQSLGPSASRLEAETPIQTQWGTHWPCTIFR